MRLAKKAAIALSATSLLLTLTGCQEIDKANPMKQKPETGAPPAVVTNETSPEQAKISSVKDALTKLTNQNQRPTEQQYRDALTPLGFNNDNIEVTQIVTPTGELPDTVQIGIKDGALCIVTNATQGVINPVAMPVLSNGKCFVARYEEKTS
ncbi:MAG: hypothetical protein QM571_02790 [Micrococcaceae bacterium]